MSASLIIGILGGCSTGASGEQIIGMTGSVAWFKTASMETKMAYFKPECRAYGFKDGTVEMAKCLQTSIQEGQANASKRASDATANYSRNKSVTCFTYGNTTTCN